MQRDWKAEFCHASYELGTQHPEDCNILYPRVYATVCLELHKIAKRAVICIQEDAFKKLAVQC